jgi:hypothetical protein
MFHGRVSPGRRLPLGSLGTSGSSLKEKRDQGFLRIALLYKEFVNREFIRSAMPCRLPFMTNSQARCDMVKDEPPYVFIGSPRSAETAVKLAL